MINLQSNVLLASLAMMVMNQIVGHVQWIITSQLLVLKDVLNVLIIKWPYSLEQTTSQTVLVQVSYTFLSLFFLIKIFIENNTFVSEKHKYQYLILV